MNDHKFNIKVEPTEPEEKAQTVHDLFKLESGFTTGQIMNMCDSGGHFDDMDELIEDSDVGQHCFDLIRAAALVESLSVDVDGAIDWRRVYSQMLVFMFS